MGKRLTKHAPILLTVTGDRRRIVVTPYTHGMFGLVLGKVCYRRPRPWLFWFLALALPIVPDLDAFSTAGYGTMAGHRGWTHTLAFALAAGLLVAGLTFRYFQTRFWVLAAFFFLITASHGFLDACTDGGFGIPFFWPLSDHRFGPWGPIAVQDIGFQWPDPRRSRSIRTELLWVWLPSVMVVAAVLVWRRWHHIPERIKERRESE
jgi:inner membrane protein